MKSGEVGSSDLAGQFNKLALPDKRSWKSQLSISSVKAKTGSRQASC